VVDGITTEVTDRVRLPGGARAVALTGVARGVAGAASVDHAGQLRIEVIRLDGALRMPPK
jgi:ATP-dependent Lon protease